MCCCPIGTELPRRYYNTPYYGMKYGVVWYTIVWCDTVWYGTYIMVWYDTVLVWYNGSIIKSIMRWFGFYGVYA